MKHTDFDEVDTALDCKDDGLDFMYQETLYTKLPKVVRIWETDSGTRTHTTQAEGY